MRSAPRAWAPSHTLHAMPPRITRNSYRPRASDRTMVALSTSLACRFFELDGIATSAEETYERGQSAKLLQGNETQWAGSRESISPSGRGGAFLLTSLFIELIDHGSGLNPARSWV